MTTIDDFRKLNIHGGGDVPKEFWNLLAYGIFEESGCFLAHDQKEKKPFVGQSIPLPPLDLQNWLPDESIEDIIQDELIGPLAKRIDEYYLQTLIQKAKALKSDGSRLKNVFATIYDVMGYDDAVIRQNFTHKDVERKTLFAAKTFLKACPGTRRLPNFSWTPTPALQGAGQVIVVDNLDGKMLYDIHFGYDGSGSQVRLQATAYLDLTKIALTHVDDIHES